MADAHVEPCTSARFPLRLRGPPCPASNGTVRAPGTCFVGFRCARRPGRERTVDAPGSRC